MRQVVDTPHGRAITCQARSAAVTALGFHATAWHPPEDTGFFQPVFTARLPGHETV